MILPADPGMVAEVTTANAWRWKYPRARNCTSVGRDAAELLQPLNQATSQRDQKRQRHLKRTTGFPGHAAEAAHVIAYELQKRGFSRLEALLAGHYVSTGGDFNFQGNVRLAGWLEVCERSVRRARATLERAGWIRSYLLLAGEKVEGQRAPVTRPRVVRDVSKLQRLARARMAVRAPHQKSGKRSGNAERVSPPDPPVALRDRLALPSSRSRLTSSKRSRAALLSGCAARWR